jgi:hypothetical protein
MKSKIYGNKLPRDTQVKKLAITIILTVTKKNWRANVYVYVSV